METKMTKENQIDEIGTKKMRTDWIDPDIVARFLKVMSVPRRSLYNSIAVSRSLT